MNRRQSMEPAISETTPLGMLPGPATLPKWLRLVTAKILAMDRITAVVDSLDRRCDAGEYARRALQRLGVGYALQRRTSSGYRPAAA